MSDLTLQELFDSQSEFSPAHVGMLNAFNKLFLKYDNENNYRRFSDGYYKEMKEIADEYGVNYTEPKFRYGLQGVDTSPTLH